MKADSKCRRYLPNCFRNIQVSAIAEAERVKEAGFLRSGFGFPYVLFVCCLSYLGETKTINDLFNYSRNSRDGELNGYIVIKYLPIACCIKG